MTRIINDNTQLGSGQMGKLRSIRSAVEMGPQIQTYDPATVNIRLTRFGLVHVLIIFID